MSEAEAIHRGWLIYGCGLFALALTALQLWTGQSLKRGLEPLDCVNDTFSYWANVVLTTLFGAAFIYLGLSQAAKTDYAGIALIGVVVVFAGLIVMSRKPLQMIRVAREQDARPMHFAPASTVDEARSITVRGWKRPELDKMLKDFLVAYELGKSVTVHVNTAADETFLVSFAPELEADTLLFLVNYLTYPKDFDLKGRRIGVAGHVVLTADFRLPDPAFAGQNAVVYVPKGDTDYDLVYVRLNSGQAYRISFTDMEWDAVTDPRLPTLLADP